jgi:riboflavin synthase
MFTGIIEDIGEVINFDGKKLTFLTKLDSLNIGDSISVNGICLTIIDSRLQNKNFSNKKTTKVTVDVSKETLQRTNLSGLKSGSKLNLERAIKLSSRLGGHIVSGHIDTTAKIKKIVIENSSGKNFVITIELPKNLTKYVVEKGSIAIDGISLTIAKVLKDSFNVVVIPHTFNNTNLKYKKVGDLINLEVDILAKYIESIQNKESVSKDKNLVEKLKESGFLN